MGANIALDFAAHGFAVRLTDAFAPQLEKARELVRANAELLEKHQLLRESSAQAVARIAFEPKFEAAVSGAEVVIEAVPEDLALKRRLYTDLERCCTPQTIFASNTSTLLPSKLAEHLRHPERFLVAHYWNPAHLLPLVELVPHPKTAPEVLQRMRTLLEACGKRPVVLKKEVPGFIGNRLAFALQREAMALVAQGVATPDEIDAVARTSFGRRIAVSGIFGTADLGGLDVYAAICDLIFPDLSASQAAPGELQALVAAGRLGVKSGRGWRAYTAEEARRLREALSEELIRQAQQDRQIGNNAAASQKTARPSL